jgi:hypothetical protein
MTCFEFSNVVTWYITQDNRETAINKIMLITKMSYSTADNLLRKCIKKIEEQKTYYIDTPEVGLMLYFNIISNRHLYNISAFNFIERFEEL